MDAVYNKDNLYGELISVADEFDDDSELNLDGEVSSMLKVWNKEQLLKDVDEMREQDRREEENKAVEYYDGVSEFEELQKSMTPVNEFVWIKATDSRPEGKSICPTSTVLMDRVMYIEGESNPIETTIVEGKPIKVNLAEGPLLPGLLTALLSMREGERAIVMIHPNLAFGPLGCPPLIPPESFILYFIKIHKTWEEGQLSELLAYEKSYNTEIPAEEKLKGLEEQREIANRLMQDGLTRDALIRYRAAIQMLDDLIDDKEVPIERVRTPLTKLLMNATVALNRLRMHRSATKTAKRVLMLEPSNAKGFYHLVRARIELNDFTGATRWLELADRLCPGQTCFNPLKRELDFKQKDETKKMQEMTKNMFKHYNRT